MEDPIGLKRQSGPHPFFEDGLHRPRQPQQHITGQLGPGLARGGQHLGDVLVVQAGDHRRDVHADRQTGARQLLDGVQPAQRRGDVGLDRPRLLGIPERDADRDVRGGDPIQRGQHVDVSFHQRRLGDDRGRVAVFDAHLQAAARQLVRRLQRLITVGDAAEDDGLVSPRLLGEGRAQQRGGRRLDDDLAVEVGAGAHPQILVRGAGVAVSAGVKAAAVGIDAVGEADVRAVVRGQDAARVILEDLEAHLGRPLQILDRGAGPGVGRIGDGDRLHPASLT